MIKSIIDKAKQYNYTYNAFRDYSHLGKIGKLIDLLGFICNEKTILTNGRLVGNNYEDYSNQFVRLMDNLEIAELNNGYVYPLDTTLHRSLVNGEIAIASVTPDYTRILDNSLEDIKQEIANVKNQNFKAALTDTIESISRFIDRTICSLKDRDVRSAEVINILQRIKTAKARTLDEAVQRILFFNGLLWQNRHQQNGLGRLDLILNSYYEKDLSNGVLDKEKARDILVRMIQILGKDCDYKSASLKGDTGQVIILGGKDSNGNEVENEITHILLDIFTKNPMPDPKLLLKVSENTSEIIWKETIDCILKGSGSPLFLNDTLIQERMVDFGYSKEDVWNFGTSACWEPLIIGKSFDQNNRIANIPVVNAAVSALIFDEYSSFEEYFVIVKKDLVQQVLQANVDVHFDKSPLMTLLFNECIKTEKDFCAGGAKYNYHGLLVVGFPNLVNAVLNVKEFVFERKLITQQQLCSALENNFVGMEDIRLLLCSGSKFFGQIDTEVIQITNELMNAVSEGTDKVKMLGNKVKIGFSSPGYIDIAKTIGATPDGRKAGSPLTVHISPSGNNVDIVSIMEFASNMKIDGNKINGNVVDFIVPTSYVREKKKFTDIIKNGFLKGNYEMQLNVLDKTTLIDAKEHPENYPNLIVRVWGFSAYFNELPEAYKDNLIERASRYEA